MIELRGKYGEAKVYTDVVDNESISQVINLLNQPYVEGSRVRMMPDIHAGAGCTIGTTMTIQDKICPNLVGVDIGCGMETIRIKEKHIELQSLDKLIRNEIPSGFAIRNKPHRYNEQIDLDSLYCAKHIKLDRARLSVGTLGGGNHFIEANKDDDGNIYIVVHSGSRHLGLEIANYYQEAGYKALTSFNKAEIDAVIAQLKSDGRQSEIQKVLNGMKKHTSIPKPLAYVEGELLDQYLHDMKIAQEFAMYNRKAMIDVIVKGLGLHITEQFTTIHNYIDIENKILRKGAPDNDISYWFEVPCNLEDAVAVGKDVLCNTRRGDMTGYIVSIMDGVPEDVAVRIIGNRFPLKNILAVSAEFKVPDIFVPWELTQEMPEPDEIAQRINEFYEYGSFRIPVSFTDTGTLLDGYSAYLVAKMFGHETLKGYCVAPQ